MTIIFSDNFHLDESKYTIDQLIKECVASPDSYSTVDHHYSTYFMCKEDRPDRVYAEQYVDHVFDLFDTKLLPKADVSISFWTQVYKGSGHGEHDHFRYNIPLSFVHFIRPSEKPCFHFVQGDDKIYPRQEPGDFILFPSWARHAVDESPTDDWRVVVAGNIPMESYYGNDHKYLYHNVSPNTSIVETIRDVT